MLNIIVKKQTIAENEKIENFVKIPKPITDPTMSYFIRVIRRINRENKHLRIWWSKLTAK